MATVHILPPEIANVIAAGEVVERPASVVKELVENAIDAGATEIVIRLDEAGKTRIVISDNGCGMSADDAVLALQRHATSKLRTPEDLQCVRTLGFRGEALPSIAAVSDFRLTTRTSDAASGVEVHVGADQRPQVREVGAPVGTCVEVGDLFATVPARRKFLKGDRTELAHIQDLVTRLALATPQTRFRLEHGGRVLLACHAATDVLARAQELFGADVCAQTIALHEAGAITVQGLCGVPALARAGASQLYTFVNGRSIRDRVIHHAIMEGYRTFIPHGEQPFVVLMITMPPEDVDVNVHPAKAEVRFVHSGAIHHCISTAVRKCLEGNGGMGRLGPGDPTPLGTGDINYIHHRMSSPVLNGVGSPGPNRPPPVPGCLQVSESLALYQPPPATQQFKPLGQIAQTYLIYETPGGGLLLVDQHAAHERIGYEAFKAGLRAGALERQLLLTPRIVELSPAECAVLDEYRTELDALGLDIEPFGDGSVAVKSVPALLDQQIDLSALLREIAADVETHGRSTAVEQRIDHLLATMACHRQVRAGDRLEGPHLDALVDDLQRGVSKDRCPHGRPTWVALPKEEIEKWFKRR